MPYRVCVFPASLVAEFDSARPKISLPETETSWNGIVEAIVDLTELCNHGGCTWRAQMIAGMRSLSKPLNDALKSERDQVSSSVIELISVVSTGLGPAFVPLVPLFMPSLLGLCATNSVSASRAKACIATIISHTQSPSILLHLSESIHHTSASLRLVAADGVLVCMKYFTRPNNTTHLIESVIVSTFRDACEDVRTAGKKILEAYKTLSPERARKIIPTIAALAPAVRMKQSEVRGTATSRLTKVPSRSLATTTQVPSSKLGTGRQKNITHTAAPTGQRPRPDLGMSTRKNTHPTTRTGPERPSVNAERPAKRIPGSRTVLSRGLPTGTKEVTPQTTSSQNSCGKTSTPPLRSKALKPVSGGRQTTKNIEPVVKAPSRCSETSETKKPHARKPVAKDILPPSPTATVRVTTMSATQDLPAPAIAHGPVVPREEKPSSRAACRLQSGAWRPCRRQSRVKIPLASIRLSTPRLSTLSTLPTPKAVGIIAHA